MMRNCTSLISIRVVLCTVRGRHPKVKIPMADRRVLSWRQEGLIDG